MARAKAREETFDDEVVDEFEIGDGERIASPVDLRSKAKEIKLKRGEKDPVQAAEAALKRMEKTFSMWIEDETLALAETGRKAEASGFAADDRADLYRSAHDIKGQAATLGFPLAGRIAGSLCLLLDHAGPSDRLPPDLVRQHVQAVRAVVAENARDEGTPVALRLAERLEEVTDDYLRSLRAL
ncbi:Hpt domain-containing protein [Prosthecomicrobium sp. N25]|uniref:Hpt domain-containing protein n=1 Tax=Prosthecomicrobium sp. N25 TaxID=3129254 RepID=UPI0030786A46